MIFSGKNRKASTADTFFWVIATFMIAMLIPIGYVFISNANDVIQTNNVFSPTAKTNLQSATNRYPSLFDGIFLLFFFGVLIGSIVLALFIDTNPAFFFVSIFIMIIMLVVGGMLANVFDVQKNSVISPYVAAFPMTLFVFENFVTIILVYAFLLAIVIYAKTR